MNFVKKKKGKVQGLEIRSILGNKDTEGEVGLEIEMEGANFIKQNGALAPYWHYTKDGSLRGEDNAEYILAKPLPFSAVPEAVTDLWKKLRDNCVRIDDSNRTSVHVHLNCQKFHLNRLTSFMAMYFSVEELLTEWCGEHRVGNLFCLRGKDAPGLISIIKRFIRSGGTSELRDGLHYAGLNANALQKFGSLEIRTMRGTPDPDVILSWVGMLRRLYEKSGEFRDPRDVPLMFSGEGPLGYLQKVLGDAVPVLRAGLSWNDEVVKESLYEGIRLAQDLCYCRDWDLYDPVTLRDDPFKRHSKVVAQSLAAAKGAVSGEGVGHNLGDQTYVIDLQPGGAQIPPVWSTQTVPPYPTDPDEEEGEDEEEFEPEPEYDEEDEENDL